MTRKMIPQGLSIYSLQPFIVGFNEGITDGSSGGFLFDGGDLGDTFIMEKAGINDGKVNQKKVFKEQRRQWFKAAHQ